MNKVNWLKVGLTIVKYAIAVIIGALGGAEVNGNVVSNFLSF